MDNDIILISVTRYELRNLVKDAIREEFAEKKAKELMTFSEMKEFLGCSSSFLNKMKSENIIPFLKLGGKRIYFKRDDVISALRESRFSRLRKLREV